MGRRDVHFGDAWNRTLADTLPSIACARELENRVFEGTTKYSACYMNFVISVFAYKKPSFCQKEGDPFSFLWRVTNRDPPSYLFGTIHVPYTEVWPHVPQNAKAAFSASDRLLLELDLVDPSTADLLSKCQMLPAGTSLSEVLPHDLYSRLERHLEHVKGKVAEWTASDNDRRRKEEAGGGDALFHAMAGEWRRKRPVWVMLLLDSLTEGEVRGRGTPVLDLFLAQEAEREGKKETEAVEEVEEQCRPLNSLNYSQVLFALNHTLTQHELREDDPHSSSSSYSTDDLIRHYNCGDLDSSVFGQDSSVAGPVLTPSAPLRLLNASSSSLLTQKDEDEEEVRSVDEYLRRELIHNRNQRMGSRVVDLLRRNPEESLFFAFGAGHFLGNNSVLDFIQDHGFEVEHLSVHAKIPKSNSKKRIQSDGLNKGQRPVLEAIFTRKGQGRRSSRHRNPIIPSLGLRGRLFDTSTPTTATTQRTKSFNDLWIRLGDNDKKSKIEIHSIGEHRGPQQAFQKWYQENHRPNNIPYTAGAVLLSSSQLLFTVTIICSYFSAFHTDLTVIVLTGIT